MLKGTNHPTTEEEFYYTYVDNLEYFLRSNRRIVLFPTRFTTTVRKQAIERTLVDFGYVRVRETFQYKQAGNTFIFPDSIIKDSPKVVADRVSRAGIHMSNQKIRNAEAVGV